MVKVELHDHQALMVVVRAMKMVPWAVAELSAEVLESVEALESALVEVVVAVPARMPVVDVVV